MGKRGPKPKMPRARLAEYARRGLTRRAAAADAGCHVETVRAAERQTGIWLRPFPEAVGREVARALRGTGMPVPAIAAVIGRSEMSVARYLRPDDWQPVPSSGYHVIAAVQNANPDMTPDDVAVATGLGIETVKQHLRRARRAGIVPDRAAPGG